MKKKSAVTLLRLVLGTNVLFESLLLIVSEPEAATIAHHALPKVVRLGLGWGEVVAAILFLLPPTVRPGSVFLLCVFAVAILIHAAHGQFQVGALVTYAAAVLVVFSETKPAGKIINTEAA